MRRALSGSRHVTVVARILAIQKIAANMTRALLRRGVPYDPAPPDVRGAVEAVHNRVEPHVHLFPHTAPAADDDDDHPLAAAPPPSELCALAPLIACTRAHVIT